MKCKPLKAPRSRRKGLVLCDELKDEVHFILNKSKEEKEVRDFCDLLFPELVCLFVLTWKAED